MTPSTPRAAAQACTAGQTQPKTSATTAAHNPRFAGKRIHFIGIGGCGMSGLAFMLKRLGAICGGSDSTASDLTDALARDSIPVRLDQASGSIPDACDLVIASAAIKPDHPEMLA